MEYHEALANDLAFKLETETRLSDALLEARGICLGMMVEIRNYEAKNKPSSKTSDRFSKVDRLMTLLDEVLKTDDHNYMLRVILSSSQRKVKELEAKIMGLEKQLKAVEEAWNEI